MRNLFRRSKDKDREKLKAVSPPLRPDSYEQRFYSPPSRLSADLLASLPIPVLERIFTLVCPHSRDESYEPCESSVNESGCMLCDLRDLAHCVQVCRAWRPCAVRVL